MESASLPILVTWSHLFIVITVMSGNECACDLLSYTLESTLVCVHKCGNFLCAALSFNIKPFSEMKYNIICPCTAATQRITSAWLSSNPTQHCALYVCCFVAVICLLLDRNQHNSNHSSLIHHQLSLVRSSLFSLFTLRMNGHMRIPLDELTPSYKSLHCHCVLFVSGCMGAHHDLFHEQPHHPLQATRTATVHQCWATFWRMFLMVI